MSESFTRFVMMLRHFSMLFAVIVMAQAFSSVCDAKTVSVAGQAEFDAALQSVSAGDVVELMSAEPYMLKVRGKNFDPAITIISAKAEQPAVITRIALSESSGINISKVTLRPGTTIDKRQPVFLVLNCRDISLTNSVAYGSATKYLTEAEKKTANGENFALVQFSDGVRFERNLISGYMQGITALEVLNLRISNNEITRLQGDSIRMGGVQNVEIADNRIHNLLGSDQSVNHSDMIQLWSTNAVLISKNISILRNRLMSGDGPATETIFMRNEQADHDLSTQDKYYLDITVKDNLIHNGHSHGITVGETNGISITNNTLLQNPISTISHRGTRVSWTPTIRVAMTSKDVTIADNVTMGISGPTNSELQENYIFAKEEFLQKAQLSESYLTPEFAGALPDTAFLAKQNSVIREKSLGSSLTWDDSTLRSIRYGPQ